MQTLSIKPINSPSNSLLTRSSQLSSYQENEEEKLQNNYKFDQKDSREQTDVSFDMVFRMKGESPKVYKRKQDMINGLEVTIEELVIGLFAGMVSKFVTCPLSNITIRLQTTASSSSRALVDQSQSRSRAHLHKPVRNTVRPNTFHPITLSRVTRARRITTMQEEEEDKDTGGFSSEVCTRPRATATADLVKNPGLFNKNHHDVF
ncbi:hypothetical protein BY996DRAFT_6448829 [Phakopsora pachyrhizi]|nr:hypothetical protein BY996DRAFT_6448829 [Phakopsora pachyrhizi]